MNTNRDWYTGLVSRKNKATNSKGDFIETCLHELQHGLLGRIETEKEKTAMFWPGPLVFETTSNQNCSLRSYENDPVNFYKPLTSNNVYWHYRGGRIARMHCPTEPDVDHCSDLDQEDCEKTEDRLLVPYHKESILLLDLAILEMFYEKCTKAALI